MLASYEGFERRSARATRPRAAFGTAINLQWFVLSRGVEPLDGNRLARSKKEGPAKYAGSGSCAWLLKVPALFS
jgi:hypothetical protein